MRLRAILRGSVGRQRKSESQPLPPRLWLAINVRSPRSRSVSATGQAYELGVPIMRRRFVLAEQLEPRLVLSVIGGSRGIDVGFDDGSSAGEVPEESSDSSAAESPRTSGSTSTASTPTVVADSSSEDDTSSQRKTESSEPTTSATTGTATTQAYTTTADRDSSTSDASDSVSVIRPTRRSPHTDVPTKPRVIVLRRAEVADDIDADETNGDGSGSAPDLGIPRRDLDAESRELDSVSSLPQDAIDFHWTTPHNAGGTLEAADFKAGQADKVVDAATTTHSTSEVIPEAGPFDGLATSLWTWLHGGETASFLNGAAHMAQAPFFALAGAFTFAAVGRKGTADANKFFRPTTDERFEAVSFFASDLASGVQRLLRYSDLSRISSSAVAAKPLGQAQGRNNHSLFELIGRRWWRDRRRPESGSRFGRGLQRRTGGNSVPTQAPVNDSPLAQPDISDAFVMSLMDSVEPDAFVMSPLPPAQRPDNDSSEDGSKLSLSMKVVAAGAAAGTVAAGSALANRRGAAGKRPARPGIRYTGTTIVPQSSLPQQAARS